MNTRLPFAPLASRIATEDDTQAVALACKVSTRTVRRWRTNGLTIENADQAAVLAGFHPSEVWGDRFYTITPGDRGGHPTVALDRHELRAMRVSAGYTIGRLAEQAGISRRHLSRIENGDTHPGPHVAGRLARVLDVDLDDLLAGTEPPR